MRLRLSVFLFFFAGFFFSGCNPRETRVITGNRDGILHLGNGAEPQDLDPQLISASTDQNLAVALFEGLTTLDEKTSQPIPTSPVASFGDLDSGCRLRGDGSEPDQGGPYW